MNAGVIPRPEALLITEMREKPPHMSMSEAARRAELSLTRWRQLENGFRPFKGTNYPEVAPAQTLAKMARVVGATPEQLRDAGRPDAAGELEAMARAVEGDGQFSDRQRQKLAARVRELSDE